MMRLNTNIAAFNAYRNLQLNQARLTRSLERLSSGLRINRAADDPSGLVRSESLRSQIGGMRVATRNAQDAISMVQTAEGAQAEVHTALQRMRDLVVLSGNTATNDDRALAANQAEIDQLQAEIDRIARDTRFGTRRLLDGTFGGDLRTELVAPSDTTYDPGAATGEPEHATLAFDADALGDLSGVEGELELAFTLDGEALRVTVAADGDGTITTAMIEGQVAAALAAEDGFSGYGFALEDGTFTMSSDGGGVAMDVTISDLTPGQEAVFQVGANAGEQVSLAIDGVSTQALGIGRVSITGGNSADVDAALRDIDDAIARVSAGRASLGAFQNRMESTIRSLSVAVENLSAAESRIRDADMAKEMMEFTRSQIMVQASTAMLAQANILPLTVLSLLP